MITQLLRSIVVGDTESAQKLGILELDEEDLALCTYSCPSKYDYGSLLRKMSIKLKKKEYDPLRNLFDKSKPLFEGRGRFACLFPCLMFLKTFYSSERKTSANSHKRQSDIQE